MKRGLLELEERKAQEENLEAHLGITSSSDVTSTDEWPWSGVEKLLPPSISQLRIGCTFHPKIMKLIHQRIWGLS